MLKAGASVGIVILLAVGTTESKVHMLAQFCQDGADSVNNSSTSTAASKTASTARFEYRQSLAGHADWVRSLSFTAPLSLGESAEKAYDYKSGDVLLASGSQDTYTRIWRITTAPLQNALSSSTGNPLDELDRLMESEIDAKRYSFFHGCVNCLPSNALKLTILLCL